MTKKERKALAKQLGLVQGRNATPRSYVYEEVAITADNEKIIVIKNDPTSPRSKYQRAKRGTL